MLSSRSGGARAAWWSLLGIGLMGGQVGAVITLDLDDAGMFLFSLLLQGREGRDLGLDIGFNGGRGERERLDCRDCEAGRK